MSKTGAGVVGLGATVACLGLFDVHAAGPREAAPAGEQQVASAAHAPAVTPQTQTPAAAGGATGESVRRVLNRYCVGCHNERLRTAGLTLDAMDPAQVGDHPDAWEKVVRRLRTASMPPAGRRRPDAATYETAASALESALDEAATAAPNPGRTTVHRLNRREYENAVRDLLALDIDASALLPADNADLGFDNMADILSVSPALLDRYIFAARRISRLAVGDPDIEPTTATYDVPAMRFQDLRMSEDLPFGSRGGIAIRHNFPLDGEYDVSIRLQRQLYDYVRGLQNRQRLEVRLDGERVAVFDIGGAPGTPPPRTFAGAVLGDRTWEEYTLHADEDLSVRVSAGAGPRVLGVSFVQARSERDGVLQPRATGKVLAIAERWSSTSEAPEAAVDRVSIAGPFEATGPGETPSRERLFVCRPAPGTGEEEACAREILGAVARRAFRRPVTETDLATLLGFYAAGREAGGFESGIQRALESILVDPEFLFRVERDPVDTRPGTIHAVTDLELASRLSFFLWSSIPDDELLNVAARGDLRDPDVLRRQVRRMLSDSRAQALVDGFALQWLALRTLSSVVPTPELFPEWDDNLREAFERETELFVASQIREDRSVLDLVRADYSFINERLAQHYGVPNVYGSRFRRVTFPDGVRGGLLGHGSILTVTSYPTRTSPVLRGHWLLSHMLGAPPPPPPPDVPALPDRGEGGRPASVRQRLEQHRENPVCANCHAPMDPLGFALEHFDAVGKWRATGEGGGPIDASGVFPDGTGFVGLAGLKAMLLERHEQFVWTVTEKLATYALGRGLEYYDMPALREIIRDAADDDYAWSSLVFGIVESTPFQMRRSES
ncbi:MAG: DUF1592 domain-containing protein [Acidobacteria bacterium]|nr:DUF1592 domain-containing protein [Acidobacteriota bacterium]